MRFAGNKGGVTFEHVFDEDAALDNFLVGMELFVVGGDEEDHFVMRGCVKGEWQGSKRYSARLVYSHAVHVAEYDKIMFPFALISRCSQVATSPFSLLGRSFLFHQRHCSLVSVQDPSAPQRNVPEVPCAITVALPENVLV